MKIIKGGSHQNGNSYVEIKTAFWNLLKVHFKTPKEINQNYHLGIIGWNMANSCLVTGLDKQTIIDSTTEEAILSKKDVSVVSKIIDFKINTYPDILLMIKSAYFDVRDKTKETFELEVMTLNQAMEEAESFEADNFDDDFEGEYEGEFYAGFIERSGIVVKPKRNFASMTDSHFRDVEWTVYLFEEVSESDEEIKDLAKPWLEDIVYTELNKYNLSLELNHKINFKFFDANFEYFFAPDVYDLMEEPIGKF